ncbi:MAG TPA: pyridoxal phosphate-dependent aminotransferase [Terriglobales bacterium]|nr:pyridoxal phosphate-dependent aminotransferase [Terriglobales bacterium]
MPRQPHPDNQAVPFDSRLPRRSFLQLSTAASAAMAFRFMTEPLLARAQLPVAASRDAIKINQNENPLGPCQAARAAVAAMIPDAGRYQLELDEELPTTLQKMMGLKPDYVSVYAGSSAPLHYAVLAFTSSTRSYVTADPGYEAGIHSASISGARVVEVPLTKTRAHDVKAMLTAAPDAGVFYVCTPNNPTGTLTPHSDIEYLLEQKPKGSIVLVDEAYIHFSDAPSVIDLVKADKDVILLRTFSKIYGMAGLRCGLAIARPDLLAKLENLRGWNAMPVPALVAALASLRDPQLVPERKALNASVRAATFQWLDKQGYTYIPSESNFFLLDTKRPGKDAIEAMARQNVIIGRVWPSMPTWVRITVGTRAEMDQFELAFKRVMDGVVVGSLAPSRQPSSRFHLDGLAVPV